MLVKIKEGGRIVQVTRVTHKWYRGDGEIWCEREFTELSLWDKVKYLFSGFGGSHRAR